MATLPGLNYRFWDQVNFRLPADTVKGSTTLELSAGGVAGAPVNVMVR
ncbi:MAG: hypothetical protein ACR2NN_22930 [Bryobacteraceae bacterium]